MNFTNNKAYSKPIPYIQGSVPWARDTKDKINKSFGNEIKEETSNAKNYNKEAYITKVKGEHNFRIPRRTASVFKLSESSSQKDAYNEKLKFLIEIFKYFTHPSSKKAFYISETELVSYPNPYKIEFRRGGVTVQRMRFMNLTLEPVFVTIYKIIPDLEQLKIGNTNRIKSQRIPVGLYYDVSLVYRDGEGDKFVGKARIVFVASRNIATPCFQVCDIDLDIAPLKIKNK